MEQHTSGEESVDPDPSAFLGSPQDLRALSKLKQDHAVHLYSDFLAQVIWETCNSKVQLLNYALSLDISKQEISHGNESFSFLSSILKTPNRFPKSEAQTSDFQHVMDQKYENTFQITMKSFLVGTPWLGSFSTQNELQEYSESTTKKLRCTSKNMSSLKLNRDNSSLVVNVLIDCGILSENGFSPSDCLKDNQQNQSLRSYVKQYNITSKGKKLVFLSSAEQPIVLIVSCIHAITSLLVTLLRNKLFPLESWVDDSVKTFSYRLVGSIAIELLKMIITWSSEVRIHVVPKYTCTHIFLMMRDLLAQSCTIAKPEYHKIAKNVAENLDAGLGKSVTLLFLENLAALGLSHITREKCNTNCAEEIHFVLNDRCYGAFNSTFSEIVSPFLNLRWKPRPRCLSTEQLQGALVSHQEVVDQEMEKLCSDRAFQRFEQSYLSGTMEIPCSIRIIVEQSFQVFVICHNVSFACVDVHERDLTVNDLIKVRKEHFVPIQVLSQFINLDSVITSGSRQITGESVLFSRLMLIGKINRVSVLRALRKRIHVEQILSFLRKYSDTNHHTPCTDGQRIHSSGTEQYHYLPDVVARQIFHWGKESRRLLLLTPQEKDFMSHERIPSVSHYPFSSYWWHLAFDFQGIGANADLASENELCIISGSSTSQENEDSRPLLAREPPSDPGSCGKSAKISRKGSDLYTNDVLNEVSDCLKHSCYYLLNFDSEEERKSVLGLTDSCIPFDIKNYQLIGRLDTLTYIARLRA